jgi:Terminase small subunit
MSALPKPLRSNGPTHTEELYDARTDANLSEASKIYRDAFVMSYIQDFDVAKALFRIGYTNHKTARSRGCQLIREPYVANKIKETVRSLKETDIVARSEVMARLWEEANNPANEGGTRVQAAAHVAKMLGMMAVKEDKEIAPVGVMLVPCMAVEDWEQAATVSQQMLKNAATNVP